MKEQENEKKLWTLLSVEKIITSNENKELIYRYVIRILDSLQNLLDSVETHDYLPIILSIIQTLSQDYPDIFNSKYEEIVDLLIGWYIDPQLPKKVLKHIDKTFEILHNYVSNHIKFILEILNNLISDVETVYQKECIEENNIATSESLIGESLNKKIFLFKCFCSLFYILVTEIVPNNDEQIKSISEVSEDVDILLVKFLSLLEKISKVSYLNKWINQEKSMIKKLSSYLGKLFIPYQYAACICSIERMELVLKLDNRVTELFNITVNDLFEMIEQWVPNLSIDVFDVFFNPQSQLMNKIRLKLYHLNNLNINIIVPIARRFFSIVEQSVIYDENLIPQDISEVIDCSNGITINQIPEFDPVTRSLKRKKFRLSEILVELQYISLKLVNKYKGESIIEMWDESGIISDNEEEEDFDQGYIRIIEERRKAYDLWKNLESLVPKNINKTDDTIKGLLDEYSYEELKNCFEYDINI
ncbi:hypothetical protein BCR36DRAFT_316243, partial [Piromyces finnis]